MSAGIAKGPAVGFAVGEDGTVGEGGMVGLGGAVVGVGVGGIGDGTIAMVAVGTGAVGLFGVSGVGAGLHETMAIMMARDASRRDDIILLRMRDAGDAEGIYIKWAHSQRSAHSR